MKRSLTSIPLLLIIAIPCAAYSIYLDWGAVSWAWFQHSGSLLALIGAILGYRSIVRLGVSGVGGPSLMVAIDRTAGYIGAYSSIEWLCD